MERKGEHVCECPATAYPACLERLAAIEAKLDTLVAQRSDLDARLRALERRDGYVMGVCAVIAVAMPWVMKRLGF